MKRAGCRHERLDTLSAETGAPSLVGRLRSWLDDVCVMTRRNLIHVRRDPMQFSDVTIQPILFTLLFIYVFGAAMVAARRRELHAVRSRRPAGHEPHHVLGGHRHRPQH